MTLSLKSKMSLSKTSNRSRTELWKKLWRGKEVDTLERRHLQVDPLEERLLLSLSVATDSDILVNNEWQDIRGDISVASNVTGDTVVTWCAADALVNPDYDPSDPTSPY